MALWSWCLVMDLGTWFPLSSYHFSVWQVSWASHTGQEASSAIRTWIDTLIKDKPFSGRWLKIAFEGKEACGVLGCLSSFPAVLCEELTVITLQRGNGVLGAVLRVWIGFSNEAETARGGLLGGRGGDHLPFLLWPFLPFLQQLSAGKLWFHTRLFQC